MKLTQPKINNTKPTTKPIRLFDGGGLYLEVAPSGGKWWRYKYRYLGKEKRLSLGVYPDVSLKEARERRAEANKLLTNGIDPSQNRKAIRASKLERAANSFEVITREWVDKYANSWSDGHRQRLLRRFECDIFPWLGKQPITDITPPELLSALQRIEKRGTPETARRVLASCGQVFRYAIATGRAERNPTPDLKGALPPVKNGHFAAITNPTKVGDFLRTIEHYHGSLIVHCALRLAPLVFVRPGELRTAKWTDIDLEKAEWRYLVTKTKTDHIVPLSTQAIAIFEELKPLTGNGIYVFPSARSTSRPMSDNAILAAMRRLGIEKHEMTGHGFRAMARTILDEE